METALTTVCNNMSLRLLFPRPFCRNLLMVLRVLSVRGVHASKGAWFRTLTA